MVQESGIRKMTPEERAQFDRMASAAEPLQKARQVIIQERKTENARIIGILERRTRTLVTDLKLSGGDTIQIRAHIPGADKIKVDKCMAERDIHASNADRARESRDFAAVNKELNAATDSFYQAIELITVDPTITAEWLKNNPDKFCFDDVLDIYVGYIEETQRVSAEREDRLARIKSFREKQCGARVRPDAGPAGDT